MKKILAVGLLFLGLASGAKALTSASSVKVKVFEMRASVNSDCSGAVTIFKTDNPTPVDLMTNPLLGSGALTNGTYHCLMFHIDDILTVVPQTTDGSCTAGTAYNLDIFTDQFQNLSATPEGVVILAHPGIEDDPWIYFNDSTATALTNDCFAKVNDGCSVCSGPCRMTPLNETSDQTHSLVINTNFKVDGSSTTCVMLQPVMSIR